MSGGSSKKITVGFKYFMGLHFGICYGPVDAVLKIFAGEREAWSGNQTANGTITLDSPELFGGTAREGGISGDLDVLMGATGQTQNTYLQSVIGTGIPAFRGILSMVLNKGYISANNPYIKPWAFQVRRCLSGWNTAAWQTSLADINGDMNPAHIIYQCLTDPMWGMGYPTSIIGSTFASCAQDLKDESFGLSMLWNQQAQIGEFIGQILNHIGGVLYSDPKTGLFELKLIREDYDPGTLPIFTKSNVEAIDSFQRVGYGETVNEITVIYRDRETNKDVGVTVHELSNIQAQGGVVSATKQYPGISNAAMASRVAQRDLIAASTPLAKLTMRVNRQAWSLIPGDVFKLTWPPYGLDGVVFRCLTVNYGSLDDGTITIDAAEDVFGLPASSYIAQEPEGWIEPEIFPQNVTAYDVLEAPYYALATTMSPADFAYVDADTSYILSIAARPAGTPMSYKLWRDDAGSYTDVAIGDFCPRAELTSAIGPSTTTLSLSNALNVDLAVAGTWAIIGTGRNAECVAIDAISTSSATIRRGIFDTVPRSWPAGSPVWFCSDFIAADETEYATTESLAFRFSTMSGGGETAPGAAPSASIICDQRQYRPYPPGRVSVNAAYFPVSQIAGDLTVAWVGRDRTLQTAGYIDFLQNNIGPEAGVTYQAWANDDNGNLIAPAVAVTTPYVWDDAKEIYYKGIYITLYLQSVRGGLSSWQAHQVPVQRNYGSDHTYIAAKTAEVSVNASSIAATVPAAALAGDMLLAFVYGVINSIPAGWERLSGGVYFKTAVIGDIGLPITFGAASTQQMRLLIIACRNNTSSNPLVIPSYYTGSYISIQDDSKIPTVATQLPNDLILLHAQIYDPAGAGNTSISTPVGSSLVPASAVGLRNYVKAAARSNGAAGSTFSGALDVTPRTAAPLDVTTLVVSPAADLPPNAIRYKSVGPTVYQSSTTLVLTAPEILIVGDLLLATITHLGTVTPPAGWTLAGMAGNALSGGGTRSVSVYMKYATSADTAATFSFTLSLSGANGGSITAFTHLLGKRIIIYGTHPLTQDFIAGSTDSFLLTIPAGDVSNGGQKYFLAATWETITAGSQRIEMGGAEYDEYQISPVYTADNRLGTAWYHQRNVAQTFPAALTAVPGLPANEAAGITLHLNEESPAPNAVRLITVGDTVPFSGLTTVRTRLPGEVIAGDRLVLAIEHDQAIASTPAGWTLLHTVTNAHGGGTQYLSVYSRIAAVSGGGETFGTYRSVPVDIAFAAAASGTAQMLGLRHMLGTTTVIIDSDFASTDSAVYSGAVSTATAAGQVGLSILAWRNVAGGDTTVSAPAGFGLCSRRSSNPNRLGIAYREVGSAETTAGDFATNVSGTNDQCAVSLIIGT